MTGDIRTDIPYFLGQCRELGLRTPKQIAWHIGEEAGKLWTIPGRTYQIIVASYKYGRPQLWTYVEPANGIMHYQMPHFVAGCYSDNSVSAVKALYVRSRVPTAQVLRAVTKQCMEAEIADEANPSVGGKPHYFLLDSKGVHEE
jgi:hypothetical protein